MNNTPTQLLCLALLLLFGSTISLHAQCSPDTEPPELGCYISITSPLASNDSLIVWASDFHPTTTDNCSSADALQYFIILSDDPDNDGTLPESESVTVTEVGQYFVNVWAVDEAGNTDFCLATLIVDAEEGCDFDRISPTVVCETNPVINITSGQTVFLEPYDIVAYAIDNCQENPHISIREAGTGGAFVSNLPISAAGELEIEVLAYDVFTNSNTCTTTITVLDQSIECINDTIPPDAACVDNISIPLEGVTTDSIEITIPMIDDGSSDNCSGLSVDDEIVLFVEQKTASAGETVCLTMSAIHFVNVLGVQLSLNYDPLLMSFQSIHVPANLQSLSPGQFGVPPSTEDGDITLSWFDGGLSGQTVPQNTALVEFCFEMLTTGEATLILSNDPTTVEGTNANEQQVSIFLLYGETWLGVNNLEASLELLENFTGTPAGASSLNLPATPGNYDVVLWVGDQAGNWNYCSTSIELNEMFEFAGQVFIDEAGTCLPVPGNNASLADWRVEVAHPNGSLYEAVTDANGSYTIEIPYADLTELNGAELAVILPYGMTSSCVTTYTLNDLSGDTHIQNFPIQLADDCSYLTVDVSTPSLRRCFENTYYVDYTSYSSFDINDAEVLVQLDAAMSFVEASIPHEDLGNGLYRFEVGTVESGSSGSFSFNIMLSCEVELGATHCVMAMITPFDCPNGSSFSELVVTGECDGTTNEVVFRVANEGDIGMTNERAIMVVEDVVMLLPVDTVQLGPDEEREYRFPADGSTFRLEVDQDDNFPFNGVAAAFVEGCNGFTQGMALQFSLSDEKPNVATDCQENIGSWDPNDKQAFPRGYGDENYIAANTNIEYLIRFQNTGTDTAFNVRIEDQISEYLDPTSLVPGASSHPYRMSLNEAGLVNFYFDNIMLPDSNINEAASHGFVKFKISQMPDNAIGTLIENTAGIYFDFNEPVITNTVPLKIGEEFVAVSSQEVFVPNARLSVAPNPFQDQTTFRLDGLELEQAQLRILSTQGRVVRELSFSGSQVQLDRKDLTPGLYFFQIVGEGQLVASGKLVVR